MNSLNRKWCEEISVRNLHSCINRNNWCPNYFNHMTFTVLWKKQSGCLEYRFKLSHCTVLITTCFFFFFLSPSLSPHHPQIICTKKQLSQRTDFTHPQSFSVTTIEEMNRLKKYYFLNKSLSNCTPEGTQERMANGHPESCQISLINATMWQH